MNGKIIKGHLCPYLDVQPKMLKTPKKKKKVFLIGKSERGNVLK